MGKKKAESEKGEKKKNGAPWQSKAKGKSQEESAQSAPKDENCRGDRRTELLGWVHGMATGSLSTGAVPTASACAPTSLPIPLPVEVPPTAGELAPSGCSGPAAMDCSPCGQWDQHPLLRPHHGHLSHLFLLLPDGKGREGWGLGPHHWDVRDSFLSILFPVTFKWLAPKRFLIAVCFSQ